MADDAPPPPPDCPNCGNPMQLVRVTHGSFWYPELRSYACEPCKEAVTLPEPDE